MFPTECKSESILKIGQYLVKLWARVRSLVFFDASRDPAVRYVYTRRQLLVGLPTVPFSPGCPAFQGLRPSPGLGLPGTQNVPYFREANVQNF